MWRIRFRAARRFVAFRRHRVFGFFYELVDGIAGDYVRDHSLMYAAALAFYMLLSLIPLLVLVASASGFIMVMAGQGDEESTARIVGDVMTQLKRAIPFLSGTLEEDVQAMLANRTSLGLVGTLALLFSASQGFRALEFSLARIFSRAFPEDAGEASIHPRGYLLSKAFFGLFLLGVLAGYFVLQVISRVFHRVAEQMPAILEIVTSAPGTGDGVVATAVSLFIIGAMFVIILFVFTSQSVDFLPTLVGGLLFAAGWEASRYVYLFYLEHYSAIGTLYGGFSTVIVTVLWVYVVSMLFMVSAHFTKVVQRRLRYGPRFISYAEQERRAAAARGLVPLATRPARSPITNRE